MPDIAQDTSMVKVTPECLFETELDAGAGLSQ